MAKDQGPQEPRDLSRCPLDEINPLDPEVNQDPHGYYRRLRDEAPVYRDPHFGIVHVSRYDDILEVIRQPMVFSSEWGGVGQAALRVDLLPEEVELMRQDRGARPTLLTCDPPAHTRYKKLAIKAFTHKRVEQMEGYVGEVVDGLINGFAAAGRCEFKSAFADNLPSIIIADAVGVERDLVPSFHRWLHSSIKRFDLDRLSREERIATARDVQELGRFMLAQIQAKRIDPGGDIISDLIQATLVEDGDGRPLDDDELLSMFNQIFVAGQETTAHALTAGLYYLIRNPDQMAALRADPELIPNFVEEALRILSPVNNMFRKVAQDTALSGVQLKAGELIMLKYGAGNHDERHFPDPDRFDVQRPNAREHLAFGMGIHRCLGAELARKEIAVAFGRLLARLDNIRLAEGAAPIRYVPNHLLRGVAELMIEFDPA